MPVADLTIRPLEEEDGQQFIGLYEIVHGTQKPMEWFEWKYATNPEIDHVPIIGAFAAGTLIGVRPLFVVPLRDRDWRGLGLEQSDAMVHPEYRRQGIFSSLVERTVERYETRTDSVFFSFPNAASWGAYKKLGWKRVGPVREGFNLHRPGSIGAIRKGIPDRLASTGDTLGRSIQTIAGLGYPQPNGIETTINTDVPADRIAALASRSRPLTIHTDRTSEYLRWRFRNPDWDYTTFIGQIDGIDTAAIITGTGTNGSVGTITRVVDIIPVTGDQEWDRTIEVLLGEVLQTKSETNVFVIPADRIPSSIRRRYGFFSDHKLPLSMVTEQTDLVVRPIADGIASSRITDRSAWSPTFIEYDTS